MCVRQFGGGESWFGLKRVEQGESGEEVEEECSRGHHSCFGCDGLGMKGGQRGQVGRGMGPERVIDRRGELP